MNQTPTIALTPGEPAGIGPELVVKVAQRQQPACLVAIADPELLENAAANCGLDIALQDYDGAPHEAGSLQLVPVPLGYTAKPGVLDPGCARYVLNTLDIATDGCINKQFSAMVTGPVQKSVINDAGIAFSGHTEYLAARCNDAHPVMMLANQALRVALYSTHLPLRDVADSLNAALLKRVIRILHHDLVEKFGISQPRIHICGLNPHAGEGGHLGSEEIEIISPAVNELIDDGLLLKGPIPADTAFTKTSLQDCDAVLAMYHDQGLPVIKHAGFGEVVNVTLGLPIIRTSVDHGTALDLAGSGTASADSLQAAVELAISMAGTSR